MLLLLVLGATVPGVAQPAEIADRVIADVQGVIVLDSDVALDRRLADVDPGLTPFWSSLWGSDAQRVLDAAAIRVVAANVGGIYTPTESDIDTRLANVVAQFPGPEAYRTFLRHAGLSEADLRQRLRQRWVVDRYLLRILKTDPAISIAWRAEAKTHLRALRARLRIRSVPLSAP